MPEATQEDSRNFQDLSLVTLRKQVSTINSRKLSIQPLTNKNSSSVSQGHVGRAASSENKRYDHEISQIFNNDSILKNAFSFKKPINVFRRGANK